MKIISKFKDYYDFSCTYIDNSIVYERTLNDYTRVIKKEEFYTSDMIIGDNKTISDLNDLFAKNILLFRGIDFLSCSFIIIGDFIKPYISYTKDNKVIAIDNLYSVLELLPEHKYLHKHVKNFMDLNYMELLKKIRKISSAPIVSYSPYSDPWDTADNIKMKRGSNFNSNLKSLGIHKLIEGPIVIQELEMFLRKEDSSDIVLSNNNKITNAGFDLKNSFRNKK